MVKEISLQNGMVALVDDEDFERVSSHNWSLSISNKSRPHIFSVINGESIILSHFILNLKESNGKIISRKDGDYFNVQKCNLIIVDHKILARNAKGHRNTSSKYKGVGWSKRNSKWVAQIMIHGKSKYLGYHMNEDDAAKAYNDAVLKYLGGNAFLNVIGQDNSTNTLEIENVSQSRKVGLTKFKGVTRRKEKYIAQISINKKMVYLGIFLTLEQAAKVYDQKAYEIYRDKAILNFPELIDEYEQAFKEVKQIENQSSTMVSITD